MIYSDKDCNCMTLIAGKNATATGCVMVAHNEDDTGSYATRHSFVPARDFGDNVYLPAENGKALIPQAAHTFAYYWTEVKSPHGGISTADTFLNENGVCVVSNSACGSKEDENPGLLTDGGVVYNLRRIIAERASSARHGASILMEIINKYGYAQSGRIYTIADKDEAFQFQLVRGKHYVGARVPDHAIVVMPNHYTIHSLSDVPEMFYSEDIITYAISRGWYTPEFPGDYSDFDFARAYQSSGSRYMTFNVNRQRFAQWKLLDLNPFVPYFPFSISSDKKIKVSDFANVMSGHNEDIVAPCTCYGPGKSIHEGADFAPICRMTTVDAQIFEFKNNFKDTVVHSSFGRPCSLPYIPLTPLKTDYAFLTEGEDAVNRMESHFVTEPDCMAPTDSIENYMLHFETLLDLTRCDSYEKFKSITEINRKMMDSSDSISPEEYVKILDEFTENNIRLVHINCKDSEISAESADPVHFELSLDVLPDPYTLCIGMPKRFTKGEFSYLTSPEGIKMSKSGSYMIEFNKKPFISTIPCPGEYRIYLGGRDCEGKTFVGYTNITVV